MAIELKKQENVILETKPHWIVLALPFLLSLVAVIVGAYLGGYFLIVPLLCIAYLAYKIAELNAHVWLISNMRVVDESGLIARHSRECPLDKVTNVSCSQTLAGRLLGFGDVEIQTASDIGSLKFEWIADPRTFSDTILQMQEDYKKTQMREQAQKLASAMQPANDQHQPHLGAVTAVMPNSVVQDYPNKAAYLELEKIYELWQKGILTEQEYLARKQKILH